MKAILSYSFWRTPFSRTKQINNIVKRLVTIKDDGSGMARNKLCFLPMKQIPLRPIHKQNVSI